MKEEKVLNRQRDDRAAVPSCMSRTPQQSQRAEWRFEKKSSCSNALAHFAFEVANAAERHPEIVLAKELPVSQNTGPFWRIFWNIPSVETGPAHPAIAASDEGTMNAQALGMILDQN